LFRIKSKFKKRKKKEFYITKNIWFKKFAAVKNTRRANFSLPCLPAGRQIAL
jgi:hypothetical protein